MEFQHMYLTINILSETFRNMLLIHNYSKYPVIVTCYLKLTKSHSIRLFQVGLRLFSYL